MVSNKIDRENIYRSFYVNSVSAKRSVITKFLLESFLDFIERYDYRKPNSYDFNPQSMKKHIIFDILRLMGDEGFRLFEVLTDYCNDIYYRAENYKIAKTLYQSININKVI